MGDAEGFPRDLPGADSVVADHHAPAAAAKNDVVPQSALLPDGMGKIAVNVHVIVLHGADAEEVIERERIELGHGENVRGEPRGLLTRQGAWSGIAAAEHAVVGLRLEEEQSAQRADKMQ